MVPFSVLMSVYHKENPDYFRFSLNSIWSQTIRPSEIILIEDGPLTPELYYIIEEYNTHWPIFKILKNTQNLGLGLSLAKGVVAASHEFIFRMDTDDMMNSMRFEKQLPFLMEGYDVVSCWSASFSDTLDNILAVVRKPEKHEDIVRRAHWRTPISHPGSAFRRSSVLMAGNYRDNKLYEDYDLWVRMIQNGCRFYCVPEPLLYFRYSTATASRRGGWKYVKNEVRNYIYFKKIGFYTFFDVIRNTLTVSVARLMPVTVRNWIQQIYLLNHTIDYKSMKIQLDYPSQPKWQITKSNQGGKMQVNI